MSGIKYFLTAHIKHVKFLQASVKLAVLCVGGHSKIYHGESFVLFNIDYPLLGGYTLIRSDFQACESESLGP